MRTDKNSDPAVWQFRESVSPHNSADLADRGQFFYRINLAVNCGKIDMDRTCAMMKQLQYGCVGFDNRIPFIFLCGDCREMNT